MFTFNSKSILRQAMMAALMLSGVMAASADAPEGYYDACIGKSKSALKSQLYTIVKNHNAITYGSSTWDAFEYTDVRDDGQHWWDIYTDNMVSITTNSGMNIEHTFPKSWWGGSNNDAYKDIVHLMPVNANANNLRSNYPFAEVGVQQSYKQSVPYPRFKYGAPVSGQGGGAAHVFEPDDEYKGDIARTYFYMVTCYQNLTWSAGGLQTADQGTYPTLQPWAIEMLLRWHRNDPVSDKERNRNEGVYSRQKNRNPFIDNPEMVEHIWGNLQDTGWKSGEVIDPDDPDPVPTEPTLTSPLPDDYYTYANLKPGESRTQEIPVLGINFKRSLVAKIEGGQADRFRIVVGNNEYAALTVTAADINDKNGYALTVRYTPSDVTLTPDEATLTLSGADLDTPVTVNLQGTCIEPTVPAAPVALPAEDITSGSYTARWMKSAQEIDGYILYRNIYNEDASAVEETLTYELDADTDSMLIDDRDDSRRESYAVTATLGDNESERSNEIVISEANSLGINEADNSRARFFTTGGMELGSIPDQPGIYIVSIGNQTVKSVIIK